MLVQRVFYPLHDSKYFLLFQSPSNNLHCDREAGHFFGVVVLVRASRDAIEFLDVEV